MAAEIKDTTSEWFRQNPRARHWERSYTKHVVDDLHSARRAYGLWGMNTAPIVEAIKLLENYWRDLHLPYEQRDDARVELGYWFKVAMARGTENARLQAQVKALTTPKKPVEFFACKHYPCATSNYFHGQTCCEHGCESVPLEWFDAGKHRSPR